MFQEGGGCLLLGGEAEFLYRYLRLNSGSYTEKQQIRLVAASLSFVYTVNLCKRTHVLYAELFCSM